MSRVFDNQSDGAKFTRDNLGGAATDDDRAAETVGALLAIADELRTANLIALLDESHHASGYITGVQGEAIADMALTRLGLRPEGDRS